MTLEFKPKPIEPKILPLVNAINELGFLRTFSSCEGHYDEDEDQYNDRNKADVRFDPTPGTTPDLVERFITYLITEFNYKYSFTPINISAYKSYCPNEQYESDYVFVVEFRPFDRFDAPAEKRVDTDAAIEHAAEIVKNYT